MPYSISALDELPSNVKKAPVKLQRQWVEVFNSAYSSCTDKGGDKQACETSAFKQANGVLKKAEGKRENPITELFESIKRLFEPLISDVDRAIVSEGSWDGSASKYGSTAAYCSACLIDVNEGAAEDKKQDLCKLPVKNKGGNFVKEGLHAAAVRFNQLKKPEGVDAGKWSAAVKSSAKKLVSLYNQMDEEPPKVLTNASRAMSLRRIYWAVQDELVRLSSNEEAWSQLLDVYEENGQMYALLSQDGKLYRSYIALGEDDVKLGEWMQVTEIHPAITAKPADGLARAKNSLMVMRQVDGRYRWVAQAATAILNRVGEIDSTKLFDNFVKRAHDTGTLPTLQFYHLGTATRLGEADFLAREGVVYINSGLFDDTPEAKIAAETLMNDQGGYWGTSIRYVPRESPQLVEIARGIKIPVYNDGIHIETSILPERRAAAWFTAIGATEEVIRMRKEIKDELLKLLGSNQELADQIEARVDCTNERAAGEGMISRETTPPEPPTEQPDPAVETPESQPPPAAETPVLKGAAQIQPVTDNVTAIPREFILDATALAAITEMFVPMLKPLFDRLDTLDGKITDAATKGDEASRAVNELSVS